MAKASGNGKGAGGGRGGGTSTGRVVRVIGPVVDVEFPPEDLPEIHTALTVERTLGGETTEIACEVAFWEWTRSGEIRHPSFKGFRDDKSLIEIVRETPAVK